MSDKKQQKIIKYALRKKFEKVKNALNDFQDKFEYGDLHDNIARIGIMQKEAILLEITSHHPRILLKDYASSFEDLNFLVTFYKRKGWEDPNGIPNYVWEKTTIETVEILENAWGTPSHDVLDQAPDEVKQYFDWLSNL